MPDLFDFCPNTRVAEELPPDEQETTSMNGWDFIAKPSIPYRAKWKVTLEGLRWRLNAAGTGLDLATDPTLNAGRLEQFYRSHRKHVPFNFQHEYRGLVLVRFASPLAVPKAIQNSNGLVAPLEMTLIHHNPGF